MKKIISKKLALTLVTGSILLASQMVSAHTRFQTPVIDEVASGGGNNYNNLVMVHGCTNPVTGATNINTIATVAVFPDGADSTVTVDGEVSDKSLHDFVTNWGSPVQKIQNRDIFDIEDEIKDSLGNVLGYWAASIDGTGLKGGLTGLVPLRTSGVIIDSTSCAKSVKFVLGIADICEITDEAGFSDATVMLWTPAVGSKFDGVEGVSKGYNSPASLTVNRVSDLPAECGDGVAVVVTPSAHQLNRDMSIEFDGVPAWPLGGGEHSDHNGDTPAPTTPPATGDTPVHVHPS